MNYPFEIIEGADGASYVVIKGRLVKILRVEYSPEWLAQAGGKATYHLDGGGKITIGE